MPGGLGPFIPLIGAGGEVWSKAATASIIFTATGDRSVGWPVAATSEIVFTATAVMDGIAFPVVTGSAEVIFTATASSQFGFVGVGSASIIFTPTSSQTRTHTGDGTATIIFMATAAVIATGTKQGRASCQIIFRVRARGKRPGIKFGDGYLGRYQIGQDVPLAVQCVDNDGNPTQPDTAPLARIYRNGLFLRDMRVPIETDADATGRFRGRYTLGNSDAPGYYAVVYLYGSFALERGDFDCFEVVDGGDPSGSVLAAYSLTRPDGDYVLAHLAAGRLAAGQTPYLDEGI